MQLIIQLTFLQLLDVYKALVNKTWRVYKLSPLYKFSFQMLGQYARHLSVHIQSVCIAFILAARS